MSKKELTIIEPEATEMVGPAKMMMLSARSIVIYNNEKYAEANETVKMIKKKYNELEKKRKSITGPINNAKESVMALFRPPLKVLSDAESLIKSKMLDYMQIQDDKRKKEEAEARKAQREEQEKLRQEGLHAAKQGDTEMAGYYFTQAEQAPVAELQVDKVFEEGSTAVRTWYAEVTDMTKLAKAVVDGKISETALLPNMTVLNGMAKSLKKRLDIPGVESKQKKGLSVRTK